MTGLLWAAEFALEMSGACFSFRKHKPLFFYLAFRALSDVVLFSVRHMFGDYVYGWAYWGQQAGAALLLCWLCVAITAQMVGEGEYESHAALLSILGGVAVAVGALRAHSMPGAILGAAVTADLFLGLAMLVGLLSKNSRLTTEWTAITWAACIQLGSEGIVRLVAHYNERALEWLPLGAIVALVVWLWAVREKPVAVVIEEEIQDVMPQRFGPESATVAEESYKGWIN